MPIPLSDGRQLVEVDSRGRVSLGKLGQTGPYLARVEQDGTIYLEPAVILNKVTQEVVR